MEQDFLLNPDVEKNYQRRSRLLTAIIFILLILGTLFLGLYGPYPPPPEEGIFINFGTTEMGTGDQEPQEQEVTETAQPMPESAAEETVETMETVNDVNATEVSVNNEQQPVDNPTDVEQPNPQPERQPVENAEPKVDPNKLFNPGNSQNSQSQNQGNDPLADGNKGQPDGTTGPNYHGQNSGLGDQGTGFDIAGRGIVHMPTDYYNGDEQGIVKLRIVVDASGKVTSAQYVARGSTITDPNLIKLAKQTALKLRYTPSPTNTVQTAVISVTFGLKR